jgi:ankyrin repeat protein
MSNFSANGHETIIKILVENGAEGGARGGKLKDTTPVMLACQNGHVEVVRALLEMADTNLISLANRNGVTAYDFAALNGYYYICRLVQDAEKKQNVVHLCVVEEV